MKKTKNMTVAQALLGGMMVAFSVQSMAQSGPQGGFKGSRPVNTSAPNQVAPQPQNPGAQGVPGDRVVMRGQLNQVGVPSTDKVNTTPLQGFADDLPLLTVLKQITPNGWIVRKDDNASSPVNVQRPVSWKGGQSWVNTLATIANNNNLDVLVNWNENTITVSNAKVVFIPKQEPKVAVFELAGTNKTRDLTTGGSEANQNVRTVANANNANNNGLNVAPISVAPSMSWNMVSTKSLKENVEEWAKQAGYRLVWTGVDYPVDNRTLTGVFDGDNGPIHQLSKDYGLTSSKYGVENRVQQPLSFLIYQNRTLVVEDIQYEQDI